MPHKLKIIQDYYNPGEKIYKKSSVELKPGLTVLCGCNGCGKSTLLRQIKEKLQKAKIPVLSFNNLSDGGDHSISESLFYQDMKFAALAMCSSEGENIKLNLGKFALKMRSFISEHKSVEKIFFLLDAVDSGLSIDHVIDMKQLFNTVIMDCKSKGIDVYIIVSANEYELARGEQCLDTVNLKYLSFSDYESYRNYIIQTRKEKNKRYQWEEWSE